jgi:hypothetical protein
VGLHASLEKFPLWAGFLLAGIPFGTAAVIYGKVDGESTRFAVVFGVIAGSIFGIVLTLVLRWHHSLTQRAVGDVPPGLLRTAGRALRGKVPADPETRAVAIRLAEHQIARLRRFRTASLIIWGLLLALTILSILDGSWWRLVLVALYLFLLVYQFTEPKRLRARIELLKSQRLQQD